jgi:hypothetical protein
MGGISACEELHYLHSSLNIIWGTNKKDEKDETREMRNVYNILERKNKNKRTITKSIVRREKNIKMRKINCVK